MTTNQEKYKIKGKHITESLGHKDKLQFSEITKIGKITYYFNLNENALRSNYTTNNNFNDSS